MKSIRLFSEFDRYFPSKITSQRGVDGSQEFCTSLPGIHKILSNQNANKDSTPIGVKEEYKDISVKEELMEDKPTTLGLTIQSSIASSIVELAFSPLSKDTTARGSPSPVLSYMSRLSPQTPQSQSPSRSFMESSDETESTGTPGSLVAITTQRAARDMRPVRRTSKSLIT